MKRLLIPAAAVFIFACRKAPPPVAEPQVPTRAVVAGVAMIDYDAATGEFSCRAPAEWRTLEDRNLGPRVMFFGPGSAKRPRSVAIAVARYPAGDPIKTPQDYWDSMQLSDNTPSPLEARLLNGRTVYALHYEQAQHPPHGYTVLYMNRADVVLIPGKDGFFALSHIAPEEDYRTTLPVFDAVVASFQPKS